MRDGVLELFFDLVLPRVVAIGGPGNRRTDYQLPSTFGQGPRQAMSNANGQWRSLPSRR